MKCLWNSPVIELFKSQFAYYRPQTKLREGYVFTGVCDSVHRGGGGIPACTAGLQAHTREGGSWGSGLEGSAGPHLRGKLRGLAGGVSRPTLRGSPGPHPGVSRPTSSGVSRHTPTPTSRRLLLWAVRILLECILVICFFYILRNFLESLSSKMLWEKKTFNASFYLYDIKFKIPKMYNLKFCLGTSDMWFYTVTFYIWPVLFDLE